VHDPRAVQLGHSIAERQAHTPDLSVPSLRQDYAELIAPDAQCPTRLRLASKNHHAPRQMIQKGSVERPINLHEVLSFMSEFDTQNLIHDIAVVRE
jgi:hypothetical protein